MPLRLDRLSELYERYAELYDLAFDWDIEDEVEWLLERLGPECRSVLEPGCGSGRVLEALARRGLEVVGLDSSPAMVELARARGLEVVLGDMTDFDLGRTFDGAVCPINTELLVRARVESSSGRRIRVRGELLDGESPLAEARAAFLHVPLEHFLATPEGRAAADAWRRRLGA